MGMRTQKLKKVIANDADEKVHLIFTTNSHGRIISISQSHLAAAAAHIAFVVRNSRLSFFVYHRYYHYYSCLGHIIRIIIITNFVSVAHSI